MSRQIVVDIVGDSSKFTKSVDAASGKASGFGNIIKGVGMGIGMGALNLATDAVGAFVGQLDEAAKAYREDQVSQTKLGVALKNNIAGWNGNTAAIEKVISANMRLGFADEEQRDSLSILVGATNDVAEAQKLQAAAMDLARLKNIDLATATDIMVKANDGNFKGLKSVGIALDSNATSADAYAAVMAVAGGQAESYANTSEGKLLASQLKTGEAWEKIGGVVDNISQVVMPVLADVFVNVVDGIMIVIQELEPVFTEVFGTIKNVVNTAVGFIKALWDRFGKDIIGTIKKYLNMVKEVFSGIFKAIQGIFDIFSGIFEGNWDKVWKGVQGVVEGVFHVIKTVVSNALDNVKTQVGSVFNGIVSFIGGVGGKIGNAAKGMWDGIWNAFRSVINSIIRGWNSIKFTMPEVDLGPLGKVGGFTIGTPNLPYLHAGGIVPGAPGSDQLAILQAGERVIPRSQVGGPAEVHIHIDQGAYIDGPSIDLLANKIANRMRFATGV